jgi:hypothetical protein
VVDSGTDIFEMDRLDTVAVWVEQEAAVVVLAVFRARTGLPVVTVAGCRPDSPELVDALVSRHPESGVQAVRDGVPSVRLGSENSPHSVKLAAECVWSIPIEPRTVS